VENGCKWLKIDENYEKLCFRDEEKKRVKVDFYIF